MGAHKNLALRGRGRAANFIRMSIDYKDNSAKALKAIRMGEIRTLHHFAGAVRKYAIRSIHHSTKHSRPGRPPFTQTDILPKSIIYSVPRNAPLTRDIDGIVGPSFDLAGLVGQAHEFGGRFRGRDYPERPFMRPALSAVSQRLPGEVRGSLENLARNNTNSLLGLK